MITPPKRKEYSSAKKYKQAIATWKKNIQKDKESYGKYTKFIIVDKDYVPMSFQNFSYGNNFKEGYGQLCYCTRVSRRKCYNPITIYTYKQAMKAIENSCKFRNGFDYEIGQYILMPVK